MIRRFLPWVLLLLCLLGPGGPARAVGLFDEESQKAIELLQDEKYVEVREIAQRMLAVNSESPMGNYLMGAVYGRGEGSLPRAHYYLALSRSELERPFSDGLPKMGMERLHAMVLEELIQVTAEMDRYQEEIDLLSDFDRVYGRTMTSWYGWPLMKLNRLAEARAQTNLALTSPDEGSRTRALNTLGAIESTEDHAQAAFNVFVQLVNEVRSRRWEMQSAFLCNAGEAAMILGRFDEAERYLLDGTHHFDTRSYSDPWEQLATLYAGQDRLPEAVAAVREMHRWSRAREPALSQQSWAFEQQVSADVLMALGYNDSALDLIRRILDRPDRRGAVTGSSDESESGLLITFRYALRLRQAELAEEMAWLPVGKWLGNWWERLQLDREVWQAGSRVAALLIENNRLEWGLRPYAVDSSVVEWMRPDLADIIGAGVVEAEIDKLLGRGGPDAEREKPYLLLTKSECLMHRWSYDEARRTLEQALATLPPAEVMVRGRAEALLAQTLLRGGDESGALVHLENCMERSPGTIRALDMALPVSIHADGDPACQTAARMLEHSPRFHDVGSGFSIQVSVSGDHMAGTLSSPNGSVLAEVSSVYGTDPTETARLFCKAFHQRVFASAMDLSQTDVTSLDGSNQTGDAMRSQIEQMLNPGAHASPGVEMAPDSPQIP